METGYKRTPLKTPEPRKSLRQKFVQSLKGKSKGAECSVEPMKVYLRVRPFSNAELSQGESQGCLEVESCSCSVIMHPPKQSFTFKHRSRSNAQSVHRFSFSYVFGEDTSQKRFFDETTNGVVKDFVHGQNCLMFSYGVTNAGKTHTIHGSRNDVGILPRTFNVLFSNFQGRIYDQSNLKPKMFSDVIKLGSVHENKESAKKKALLEMCTTQCSKENISTSSIEVGNELDVPAPGKFALWISLAEIYNEQIFDLLEHMPSEKEKKRTVLKLGDDKNGNPYIKGLRHVLVVNAEEAHKVLKVGQQNQKNASTKLNNNSSRSHCVINLKLARVEITEKDLRVVKVSQLSFVDLAGSERYVKTQSSGERLKEAGNINTSIMTLGKCVEILRYNQKHTSNPRNVPFRESKLTRLLQVFFCGQGKVSMVVNVNQCASTFDETLHALKFSAIARKVATINIEPTYCSEEILHDDSENLITIINTLQSKLTDEAIKNAMMELKIREEVSQEVSEQMAEIENNYSKRLVEEENMNEEVCEKRMELLANSVRKSIRRRPGLDVFFEDEESTWVSKVLLQREQIKVKKQEQMIQCLKDTIENQKNLIEELRQDVNPRKLTFVSLNSSENSLKYCGDEEDNEDVFPNATPPYVPRGKSSLLATGSSMSNKRNIFGKLEGLVETGSTSVSRSAKKLKRKVFNDSTSSPSSFSLPGNRSRVKTSGNNGSELSKNNKNFLKLRSRKV